MKYLLYSIMLFGCNCYSYTKVNAGNKWYLVLIPILCIIIIGDLCNSHLNHLAELNFPSTKYICIGSAQIAVAFISNTMNVLAIYHFLNIRKIIDDEFLVVLFFASIASYAAIALTGVMIGEYVSATDSMRYREFIKEEKEKEEQREKELYKKAIAELKKEKNDEL